MADRTVWHCVCAGQGGGNIYSSGCPVHDETVDTDDIAWRKWYDEHLEAQGRIREKLGW